MLEKLNSFTYDAACHVLLKQLVNKQSARAEFNTLKELSAMAAAASPSHALSMKVPQLYPDYCTTYSVAISYIVNIRLLDLLALLNQLTVDSSQSPLAAWGSILKQKLISHSLQSVATFQDRRIQTRLKDGLGSHMVVYDYFQKLKEAIEYLVCLYEVETPASLWNEVESLGDFLSHKATVLFRDASLKNQVLMISPGSQNPTLELVNPFLDLNVDCPRPSEQPWTDMQPILELIKTSEDGLEQRIYNIDFESAYTLTVPQDDYLHILCSEVAGLGYPEILQKLDDYQVADEYLCNHILIFRYFREWVRRLFYRYERQALFANRYRYETPEYYFTVAFEAFERLRSDTPHYLDELYALMCACSPTQSPPRTVIRADTKKAD